MGTTNLRDVLNYFGSGNTDLFELLLDKADDCHPAGDVPTLQRARFLKASLLEAEQEARIEVIRCFDRAGMRPGEIKIWLERIAKANRAAGCLEGRFAFNDRPADRRDEEDET